MQGLKLIQVSKSGLSTLSPQGTSQSTSQWKHQGLFYWQTHYNDVIMCTIASQITSLTIVYSTVYSDADQRKYQSSASLAFVRETGEFPAQLASNAENISI